MSKIKLNKENHDKLQSLLEEYGREKVLKAVVNGFKVKKDKKYVKCDNCNGLGYKIRSFADSCDNVIDCYKCQGKGSF